MATYHLLYLSADGGAWICPSTVKRQPDPNDALEWATPNHFETRAGANDYIRRRGWKAGTARRVEQCTWPECQRNHLPEFLAAQPPAEVAAWRERREKARQAKRERAAARRAKRESDFEARVSAEVARRLAKSRSRRLPTQSDR